MPRVGCFSSDAGVLNLKEMARFSMHDFKVYAISDSDGTVIVVSPSLFAAIHHLNRTA